jgi:hypothetical protein
MKPSPSLITRPERRAGSDGVQRLTVEELALLASCGERIRISDWPALRRAGFVRSRAARWLVGGTALLTALITSRALRRVTKKVTWH